MNNQGQRLGRSERAACCRTQRRASVTPTAWITTFDDSRTQAMTSWESMQDVGSMH